MQVVELAHRSNSAQCHLQKGHARRVVYVFRSQSFGGAVHHFAPGPEGIFIFPSAVFGAAAYDALKRVGVGIDETGKNGAITEMGWLTGLTGDGRDLSAIVTGYCTTALKFAVSINQLRQP